MSEKRLRYRSPERSAFDVYGTCRHVCPACQVCIRHWRAKAWPCPVLCFLCRWKQHMRLRGDAAV